MKAKTTSMLKQEKKIQPVKKPKKYTMWFLLGGFILLFLTSYSYIFYSHLDLSGDNFAYLLLGKSMAQGLGYTGLYSPGAPPASHFPPGYSALLGIFMWIGTDNVVFFKILNGIFLLASVCLLAYCMYKITNNKPFAWCVGVLVLFNGGLLSFATMIMSEMPYLFYSCLAFFCLYKLDERKDFWRSAYFYIMVMASVAAYYTRSIALALFVSIALYYFIRKKWKISIAYIGLSFLLYLPWIIRNAIYGIKGRYLGMVMTVNPWRPEEGGITTFGELFNKMLINFDETVIKAFKEVLFPFMNIDYAVSSTGMGIFGAIIILAIIFYGAWNLGKYRFLFILYLLGNIGTFVLWHGGNGARYVHPLAPFIIYTFFWGIISTCAKIPVLKKVQQIIPYFFLILLLFLWPSLKRQHEYAKMKYPPAYQNYFNIAKSFNPDPKNQQSVNKDIIVCCRKPEMFSYFSNCLTVNYLNSTDPLQVVERMQKQQVDYVVYEQLGYGSTLRYLYPAITAYPELFEPVILLENPDTYLLRFNKQKADEVIKGAVQK